MIINLGGRGSGAGVMALHAATGKTLWQRTVLKAPLEKKHRLNSHASSTPATDGEHLYVFFGKTGVLKFDLNGNQLWQTFVGDKLNGWGCGTSPVLYKERIFSVTKNGTFFVRDARTGDVEKRKRLPWGNYQPSLVAGDGKVYVMNEEGLTVVFGVDEEGVKQLARNQLPGGSGASPAIAS